MQENKESVKFEIKILQKSGASFLEIQAKLVLFLP